MSYKQYTVRNPDQQMSHQWVNRRLSADLALAKRRQLTDYLNKYLPPNGNVLEAGCGIGAWVKIIQSQGHEVIGIDWYADIVQAAHEADSLMKIEQGDISHLRFAEGTFDAYISLGVIEHFEAGPENALREAYRVLKPGGVVVITVPALNMVRRWLAHPFRSLSVAFLKLTGRKVFFAEYRYTMTELIAYVEGAGFQTVAKGTDDVRKTERKYHMGIYCDWPFCRGEENMQLNWLGRIVRKFCSLLPYSFFAAGIIVIAQKQKR
jgi:ubiquinone/menaquinone biosynthesis C-methylase UbiE